MELCIDMINQSKFKGKALAETILSHLKSLNLPMEKMIGQGNDGASSMSGKEKGFQAIVKESCQLACCICSLFGTCVEFSFGKILCNT